MKNSSSILLDGYLLKKKRDNKKSLLTSKYQKRFFELTSDTLAYAKDPRELKDGGGNIEVFSIHELEWIKKKEDLKLEMKFPERMLRVKAESTNQADKWLAAIEKAMGLKTISSAMNQTRALDTLKKNHLSQYTIEMDSDDDDDDSRPVNTSLPPARPPTPPKKSPSSSRGLADCADRPPSPRSLLANPRMGNMMISTPTKYQPSDEEEAEPYAVQPVSRWSQPSDSESEPTHSRQRPSEDRRNSSSSRPQPPPPEAEKLVLEQPAPRRWSPQRAEEDEPRRELPKLPSSKSMVSMRSQPAERVMLDSPGNAAKSAASSPQRAASPGLPPRARTMVPSRSRAAGEVLTLDGAASPARSHHSAVPSARVTQLPPEQHEHVAGARPGSSTSAAGRPGTGASSGRPGTATSSGFANSGTEGDENWLDSDWDSSDDERPQRGRRQGDDDSAMNQRQASKPPASSQRAPVPPPAPRQRSVPAAEYNDGHEDEQYSEQRDARVRTPVRHEKQPVQAPKGKQLQRLEDSDELQVKANAPSNADDNWLEDNWDD
mmetsp:Transcript_15832/g.34154  ORF Transcript_15832/g.34154 Transcript_15832/m.34154 type:complete len:546 (+) Transcript_15832:106-1743(+)|eukprot:CAMPEP_0202893052 /NCGR_PEP_ID=MMETSP1392-20130828/2694_1 /ASSEMBLY_ACC=CAM_ASM_000868 /TAXON_ID=225041 /ORGANISM="Chlamydomonas chlamydogama, Strain SAG 11-48b" /LENGTH=545 /DNA_ID=CAMNT_0049577235 /DNA_START=105 /DNA_END=1742 /DNA_ORIENTATION=-